MSEDKTIPLLKNQEKGVRTKVPCNKCGGRVFEVSLTQDLIDDVKRFPFTIVLMHVGMNPDNPEESSREVHTMVAYIDKQFHCRHVQVLTGRKVFVTPYIVYNPNLLYLSCNKNLSHIR